MTASLILFAVVGLVAMITKRIVAANALIDRLLATITNTDEGDDEWSR